MKVNKIRGVICMGAPRDVCVRRFTSAAVFLFFLHPLSISCSAAELKQKTVQAFDRYVRATETRMDAGFRPGSPFSLGGLFAPTSPTTAL